MRGVLLPLGGLELFEEIVGRQVGKAPAVALGYRAHSCEECLSQAGIGAVREQVGINIGLPNVRGAVDLGDGQDLVADEAVDGLDVEPQVFGDLRGCHEIAHATPPRRGRPAWGRSAALTVYRAAGRRPIP